MKSATAFLPMSSASIRSLAMPCLAGTPKDKKYGFIVFKTRTKRIGEARNCLQYSFYLASEQIEYFISVHWRVVSIYWALMWWIIHHSICSTKCSSSCWSLYYLFIVCLIVMSKAILKQRTNDCDTLNTFCSRSFLHLRCVLDKFMSVISYTGT